MSPAARAARWWVEHYLYALGRQPETGGHFRILGHEDTIRTSLDVTAG
jgi:hypothetical protein